MALVELNLQVLLVCQQMVTCENTNGKTGFSIINSENLWEMKILTILTAITTLMSCVEVTAIWGKNCYLLNSLQLCGKNSDESPDSKEPLHQVAIALLFL